MYNKYRNRYFIFRAFVQAMFCLIKQRFQVAFQNKNKKFLRNLKSSSQRCYSV